MPQLFQMFDEEVWSFWYLNWRQPYQMENLEDEKNKYQEFNWGNDKAKAWYKVRSNAAFGKYV